MKSKKLSLWIFVGVVFFVSLLSIIYFFYFKNSFSIQDISLSISGEKEVKAGDKITWLMNIKNNSQVGVEILNLTLEYPIGTFDEKGNLKKREESTKIKQVPAGQNLTQSFTGIIFGKKGETKKVKAFIVYRPRGLSTMFQRSEEFDFILQRTNIFLNAEIPEKVVPKEKFDALFYFKSDFEFPLTNIQLKIFFPLNFHRTTEGFQNEEIVEKERASIFDLGTLNSGEGGKIEIEGWFDHPEKEEVLFRVALGKFDERLYQLIPLAEEEKYLKVKELSLEISRKVNGAYEDYVALPGERLNYIINFKNKSGDILQNLTILAEIKGEALDFASLLAPGGKIEGNKITFSGENIPSLNFLGPYGEGSVGFEIKVKEDVLAPNAKITETITLANIQKELETKIASKTSFKEEIYYNLPQNLGDKLYPNIGPFPLEENKETSLVLFWKIENKGNNLEEAKIETELFEEVEALEEKFPQDSKFVFDKEKKELTLNIGNIGWNFDQFFAIKLKMIPSSLPQKITSGSTFKAKDSFTQKEIEITLSQASTENIK